MTTPAIVVEDLSKRYRIGRHGARADEVRNLVVASLTAPFKRLFANARSLRKIPSPTYSAGIEPLEPTAHPHTADVWALKNVSFEVSSGEVLGIIGHNGAGKSSLLKILSRITQPTTGRIRMAGRLAALLEVGTGFHPELTGRENIYLNGTILGMSKKEIDAQFDAIVDFSGVEAFIDTPVKRYSSGMFVRLGFAVAAHLQPEILIVDEVLAVGDAAFQKRCLGKIKEVACSGRTILFVSHNLSAVAALCTRALLLDHGRMICMGETTDVLLTYNSRLEMPCENDSADFTVPLDSSRGGQIIRVSLRTRDGKGTTSFSVLDQIDIEFDFILQQNYPTLILTAQLWRADQTLVLATVDSDWDNYANGPMYDHFPRDRGRYRAKVSIPPTLINHGRYELEVVLTVGPSRVDTFRGVFLTISDANSYLSYVTKSSRGGVIATPLRWNIDQADQPASAPITGS